MITYLLRILFLVQIGTWFAALICEWYIGTFIAQQNARDAKPPTKRCGDITRTSWIKYRCKSPKKGWNIAWSTDIGFCTQELGKATNLVWEIWKLSEPLISAFISAEDVLLLPWVHICPLAWFYIKCYENLPSRESWLPLACPHLSVLIRAETASFFNSLQETAEWS